MIVEFGNHAALRGIDERPKVTRVHIPEADDRGQGGYTHAPGLSIAEFRDHRQKAIDYGRPMHLPDHEIVQCILNAWSQHAVDAPAWVKVNTHEELHGLVDEQQHAVDNDGEPIRIAPHGRDVADDLEGFLRKYFEIKDGAEKPADLEDRYWTVNGAPGQFNDPRPSLQMRGTNAGRVMANINDGGGQTGLTGTGTAATATSLTTNLTLTTNAWAGYRVYVMQTATGPLIWGNVLSNTNAAGASVLTVDRWYTAAIAATAPTAPSAGYYFLLADGGAVSSWFVALTTTNITPADTDTSLTGEYYNATDGIGNNMNRKLSPYAQTSGTSPRSLTLSPVYTASANNGAQTFYAIGVFASLVQQSAYLMKFETSLNASATIATTGDQVSCVETITGGTAPSL